MRVRECQVGRRTGEEEGGEYDMEKGRIEGGLVPLPRHFYISRSFRTHSWGKKNKNKGEWGEEGCCLMLGLIHAC